MRRLPSHLPVLNLFSGRQTMKKLTLLVALALLLTSSSTAQGALVIAEDLLVNLDAQDLPLGQMTSDWVNQGSVVGDFVVTGNPLVEDVDDGTIAARAMTLDGDDWFGGPVRRISMTRPNRTWVIV